LRKAIRTLGYAVRCWCGGAELGAAMMRAVDRNVSVMRMGIGPAAVCPLIHNPMQASCLHHKEEMNP
jgi:hypothetical protein